MEPKVPSKEEFDKMTPAQKAARKREAMMQNLTLSPEEKKAKEAMEAKNKPAKKMMAGGMAKKYKAGGKLDMVKGKDGKMVPDYAADGKGKMKAGGKVRGYGMARGGKVCKMR
jgi:hypothetical protein